MLCASDIPDTLKTADDGLYGDIEAFMASYTSGEQSASWSLLEAQNAVCDEMKVRCFLTSLNYAATPASPFVPC